MNKFAAILLTVISMFAAAALWGGQQANAVSIYDNTVQLQEEPLTLSYFGNHITNYSYDELLSEFRACALADYTNFLIAQINPNGAVAVSQKSGGGSAVWFYYSLTGKYETELQFSSGSVYTSLEFQSLYTSSDIKAVVMNKNSNGDVQCTEINHSNINNKFIAYNSTSPSVTLDHKPFFNQFYIIEPLGYEGEEIPTQPPLPPIDPKEYYPRVSYTYYGSTLLRGIDAAIDLCIPFDPDYIDNDVILADGAYYMDCADWSLFDIEYKLIDDNTDVIVDTQVLDRIDETYEFNEIQHPNKYRLEVRYLYTDCGAECLPNSFNRPLYEGATLATSVMMIDTTKGTFSGLSDDVINCTTENGVRTCDVNTGPECFSLTAPFIDLPACLSDINVVVHNLSFGAISFVKVPPATECKTLGTIGEWLPLENKTVCPQVPKTIRDIITPFITFALGMMIVIMISKIARGSNT